MSATDPTVAPTPALDPTLPGEVSSAPEQSRPGNPDDLDALPVVDPSTYRRDGDLARGGMGRIVKARDRRLGRTVAIKELLGDSPSRRQRFEREIRLTARLEHPSIVAVHEAGRWPDGEQFFAMRLVPGRSLDVVMAERKSLADRLALLPNVIAAADALAYAHGERVIHRDLKPANILAGDFGETVVIDWGLAKDLDNTGDGDAGDGPYRKGAAGLETVAGAVMGTPAYMPPEQAEGDPVDERCDVYALGAILYHALTGQPPYQGKTVDDVLVKVLSGPPTPLDQLTAGVPVDLITIVDKAMARDPKDRYPTAKQLVADLKRFQTGQLVGAHRYSTRQLLARWLRRHRLTVAIAAVLVVALAVVGVVSWQRDVEARAVAERHRAAAVTRRDAAERLVEYLVFQLRDRLEQVGRLDILAATSDSVLAYYRELGDLGDSDPTADTRRASALTVLGDVAQARGDLSDARALYAESLAIHQRLRASQPDEPLHQSNSGRVHAKLGTVEQAAGRADEALAHLRASLELRQALATRFPGKTEAMKDLASAEDDLGILLLDDRRALDDAERHLEESFRIRSRLSEAAPTDVDALTDLARAHENLGDLVRHRKQLDGAVDHYRSSIDLRRRAAAARPDDSLLQNYLAAALDRAGMALMLQERVDDAVAVRTEALAIRRALARLEPDAVGNQREIAILLAFLGDVASARGDLETALREYQGAIDVLDRIVERDADNLRWKDDLAVAHQNAGNILLARGDLEAAQRSYQRNLELCEAVRAKDPSSPHRTWGVGVAHEKIGDVAAARGDRAGAAAAYRTEVEWLRRTAELAPQEDQYRADLAWALANLAAAELAADQSTEALAHLGESLTIRTELTGRHPERDDWQIDLADSHDRLAAALGDRSEQARGHLDRAIAILEALERKAPLPPHIVPGLASLRQRRGT